jgi:hypothetical protein
VTIQWGDTGKVAIGTSKTFNITFATPREPAITAVPSLPTAQDASVGATFTIQQSDLPVISPSPVATKYSAIVIVAGKNTSGASANVTSQGFKNSTSVATSSALAGIANNNYWTHSMYRFPDVTIGDVLNVQVWASVANVSFDYCALVVYPTQFQLAKAGTILKDVSFTNWQAPPAFTGGILPSAANAQNGSYYLAASHPFGFLGNNITLPALTSLAPGNSLGYRITNGDVNSITGTGNSPTSKPNYYANKLPCTITFREVLR